MRRLAVMFALLCWGAAATAAADIKTGRDLVDSCRDYVGKTTEENARMPHPCRTFLQGFAVTLKAREDARLDAMVKGLPFSSREACVRMPDFISFRELAQRIVRYADTNPGEIERPASELAQRTLEHDFPCPPPPAPRQN